jgi:hypothetical protein
MNDDMTEPITTATEMNPLIGKIGDIAVADLRFTVRVVDVRVRWGRTDVQVEPLSGTGRAWKSLESIINLRVEPLVG